MGGASSNVMQLDRRMKNTSGVNVTLKRPSLNVTVRSFDAYIENSPTRIDERNRNVMKYVTPHFRGCTVVQIPPLKDNDKWTIGWVQACTSMEFTNTYGENGRTSWEFPELSSKRHKMVSDSDGTCFPWYGSGHEIKSISGPTRNAQEFSLKMNDNFYPHVTWCIPVRGYDHVPALTEIERHQTFYTWLMARNDNTGMYHVLKTLQWRMDLKIVIDPTKAQGQRAKLVSSPMPEQPLILGKNICPTMKALVPPNANSAQTLIWKPNVGNWKLVIQPIWLKENDEKGKYQQFLEKVSVEERNFIHNYLNDVTTASRNSCLRFDSSRGD